MTIFDLIFLGFFLAMTIYGGWILTLVLRRRWPNARRHALRWAAVIALYLAVVMLAGILSPRRIWPPDGILRFDDWCLAVEGATQADAIGSEARPDPENHFIIAALKVISTARRVRQAAPNSSQVYLIDNLGNRYDVSERGQSAFEKINGGQPALTQKLDPQSSFLTTRVFEVPRGVKDFCLAHRHGTAFPGILIIGDGFRKPAVIQLQLSN